MRKSQEVLFILTGFFLFILVYSCDSTSSGDGGTHQIISSFNSTRSHNTGENCINCHISGGGGDGFFSIAGTVYEKSLNSPLPNSIVRIYSTPDGNSDPILVVEVDAKGNFYTTEAIDFGEGLYTSVEGPSGEIFMESAITEGSCNSCHGVSTQRIRGE